MKNALYLLAITTLLTACGEKKSEVEAKKEELMAYKMELKELKTKITATEAEVVALDPTFGKKENNAVLVSTVVMSHQSFSHKIEARGSIQSRNNVTLSAELSGKVESIKVVEGQRVSKGQVLATLNADVIRNNIAELRTGLELATVVFERQENLWKQKIGTEIKYLEAKNAKESLERKLATANAQLAQAIIKAPFAGSIDAIPARVGELAQPGMALIRIVNPNDMYIKADLSEKYIGNLDKGQSIGAYFPSQDKKINTVLGSVSQVINNQNRTFEIEVKLPSVDFTLKPNQVVVLNLTDYKNDKAMLVPTKVVQRDNKGQFVYVIENNKAKKKHVTTGLSYDNKTEIKAGLSLNEVVAFEGYRELAEDVMVKIASNANDTTTAKVAVN